MPKTLIRGPELIYHRLYILIAGLLISAAGYLIAYSLVPSNFVRHMILHIAIMGPVACMCALLFLRELPSSTSGRNGLAFFAEKLWLVTCIQILVFLAFHAPFVHKHLHSTGSYLFTLSVLLVVSIWYWSAILRSERNKNWQAIISLLVTGKTFCLIAVLLIFSPRSLYSNLHHLIEIGEQQLAGLIMIVVCPLSYVVTAILLFMKWLDGIEDLSEPALSILEDEKP